MASDDVLNLSLDEIIKRNQGNNYGRRGRGRGQSRGRKIRGRREAGTRGFLSRDREEETSVGNSHSAALGGRLQSASSGIRARLNRPYREEAESSPVNYDYGEGFGEQSNELHTSTRIRRLGRRNGTSIGLTSRKLTTKSKIQQAREILVSASKFNRIHSRLQSVDERRGFKQEYKTKSNSDTPLRVRVGNGTIVKGLRSDRMILNKIRDSKRNPSTTSSSHTVFESHGHLQKVISLKEREIDLAEYNRKDRARKAGSLVSLTANRGLTVSINNNSRNKGSVISKNIRGSRSHMNNIQASPRSSNMFTVVNDHITEPMPQYHRERAYPQYEMAPPPSRYYEDLEEPFLNRSSSPPLRVRQRHIVDDEIMVRNLRPSLVISDVPRSIPEPHKQILDPRAQKEIAMLQGKSEVALMCGPGPGVKGLKLTPVQTSQTLNERFTQERIVTD